MSTKMTLNQPDLAPYFGNSPSPEPRVLHGVPDHLADSNLGAAAAIGLTSADLAVARHMGHAPDDVAAFKKQRARGLFTLSGATGKPCSVILQP